MNRITLSTIILASVITSLSVAPNALASTSSNTDKLTNFFVEETNVCYSKYYSEEHLNKNPDQQTTAIYFEHIRSNSGDFDIEKSEFYGTIFMRLRDGLWYFGSGFCKPNEKGFRCGIEDDGGHYIIQKKGSAKEPRLLITNNDITLWNYDDPIDAELSDTEKPSDLKLINSKPDDNNFLLEAENPKFCLEEFQPEVSDGIDMPESSEESDTVEMGDPDISYVWKDGGEFKLELTADQEVSMKLEDNVLSATFNKSSKVVTVFDFNDIGEDEGYKKFNLTMDDYNFDGFKDFAIVTSIGYGGVNVFSDVFLYDESVNNFRKSDLLTGISNIELDTGSKELFTSMRGGQKHYGNTYHFNAGKPWHYSSTTWFASDAEETVIYHNTSNGFTGNAIKSQTVVDTSKVEKDAPLFRKITVDKALLYEQARWSSESGMYLIKGDKVQILKFGKTKEYGDWVFIRFKGKKLVEQWLPFDVVDWKNY